MEEMYKTSKCMRYNLLLSFCLYKSDYMLLEITINSLFFFVINFFLNLLFLKNLSGIPSECRTVWIQIRPDVLSGLIQIQTVCKGYQQMIKIATSGGKS